MKDETTITLPVSQPGGDRNRRGPVSGDRAAVQYGERFEKCGFRFFGRSGAVSGVP